MDYKSSLFPIDDQENDKLYEYNLLLSLLSENSLHIRISSLTTDKSNNKYFFYIFFENTNYYMIVSICKNDSFNCCWKLYQKNNNKYMQTLEWIIEPNIYNLYRNIQLQFDNIKLKNVPIMYPLLQPLLF